MLNLLTTTPEVAQELNVNPSMVIWHLKQIGKVEKLDKWVPHELTKKKKIIVLKCHLLLLYATNHLLIGLWHVTKSGFYTTTGNDLLSGWTKKKLQSTFQSQTCTKKRSWSLSWWSAAHLIYYSSLNPGVKKPLHLRSMLSKSMRCTETEMPAASTGPTEWAQFISMTTPDHTSKNQLFKSWMNWAIKFCLNSHINYCQPITTSSSISTTFCRQITSTTSMKQKMISKSSTNPAGWIFTLQE